MKKYYLPLLVAVLSVFIIYLCFTFEKTEGLEVSFLDIGQGDSILLRATPSGHTVLIDGGPNAKVLEELAETLPFYEKTIDVMVLSHPHADHLNGLLAVLDNYKVEMVLVSAIFNENPAYQEFFKKIEEQQIPLQIAEKSRDIEVGPIMLDIIYPQQNIAGKNFENENNSSIAITVAYAEKKILLVGDAEDEELKNIYKQGSDFKADIYKAAHHGSDTSIFEPFVRSIKPYYVAVQCGSNNSYGHPNEEFLEAFSKYSIKRTDIDGKFTYKISSDGNIWEDP